ncbi:unnamed protein product [Urochloa decumbens]|uniref:RING-type domain-containing protein n=1 Tax=Urochloa decumbens TaxID=240449 RepID=A0ABC9EDK9_9POAL
MGFPLVSYCLAVPKPVVAFCRMLSVIRDAVMLMLAVFGLARFPFHDGGGSSAAPDAPRPEEVKAQLPAVQYAQLRSSPAAAYACHHDSGDEASSPATTCCVVCLETVGASDQVRRLGNCAHAFHRGCIDRWIDLGRGTCPLCRADLLPRPTGRAGLLGLGRLLTRLVSPHRSRSPSRWLSLGGSDSDGMARTG